MASMKNWIDSLPKAELHIHIDGSLQAQRMLDLAKKNKVSLPYKSITDIEKAYDFKDLQSFLDLYYLGASVLKDEEDFYHLMMDYLIKCKENNIVHTEIMIEPQTYLPDGIGFDVFMSGFKKAVQEAKDTWGMSVFFILSLLKHTSEEECIEVLNQADAYRNDFYALGMASTEIGNPPEKFKKLFQLGKEKGYRLQTHAGEEGPPEIIWGSIKDMQATRIDHGVSCSQDQELVAYLKAHQIPLTVCPLSNVKLKIFENINDHNIVSLLHEGLLVTVNSDDPAYFGGYLNDNYQVLYEAFGLNKHEILQLVKNGFIASYLDQPLRETYLNQLVSVSCANT